MHVVATIQTQFAYVGFPKSFAFYWLSLGERWHSALHASDLDHGKGGSAMYRISETVRSIHNQDGAILLDIRQGQMFNVNFVGSRILELLKNGATESAITDQVSLEFGVGRKLAEDDLREFLQSLKKCHLVDEWEPVRGA
jgi:Coenzyme PQQ synthesis protein D (PqqD)